VAHPAPQRVVADQRDLALGVDPVPRAKLTDQPDRVGGSRPLAMRHQQMAPWLHRPATRIQRAERQTLLGRGYIQRVRPLAAFGILTAHDASETTEPQTGLAGEALSLAVEPLPSAIEELLGSIDIDAGRTGDLVEVHLLEMLDRTFDLLREPCIVSSCDPKGRMASRRCSGPVTFDPAGCARS
jgi:hypothetical protein